MSKNWKLLIIVALLMIAGLGVYAILNWENTSDQHDLQPKINNNVTSTSLSQPKSENSTSTPVVWKEYHNTNLGFSIMLPSKDSSGEIKPIEHGAVVFISSPFRREEINNIISNSTTAMEKSKKINWAILTQNVAKESELADFIKQRYGPMCKADKRTPSKQDGVYDLEITVRTNPDTVPIEQGCFVNYITIIKYSPKFGKVATWSIGQDINFAGPNYNRDPKDIYDFKMADSFKFLE